MLKRILNIVTVLYLVVLLFPNTLFAKKLDYKCFSVYYHSELDTVKLKYVLDKAIELLNQSDLFDNNIKQNIFFCNSFGEFTFFAPFSRKAFAINLPLTQNVFVAKYSVSEDLSFRNGEVNNQRSLSGVIAHETTHSLIENKLGVIKTKTLPTWKNEGYCDYIAKESSFDDQKGMKIICNYVDNNESPSFKYFKYKTVTKYLFEEEQVSVHEFFNTEFDLDKIYSKVQKTYCK